MIPRGTSILRCMIVLALLYAGVSLGNQVYWSYHQPLELRGGEASTRLCGRPYELELSKGILTLERNLVQARVRDRDLTIGNNGYSSFTCTCGDGHYQLTLRGELVVLMLMVYPLYVLIIVPVRRHLRVRRQFCPTCGYCLVGNVSGKCSECGNSTAICLQDRPERPESST